MFKEGGVPDFDSLNLVTLLFRSVFKKNNFVNNLRIKINVIILNGNQRK